jgi:exodeoxyribonuclease VII small subunit
MTERPDYAAMTFEELVSELEELTERMASGEIGIEEAAQLYEQAEQLHALAAERLARVQARIQSRADAADRGTPAPGAAGLPADSSNAP